MQTERITVTQDGTTLSRLLARRYRRRIFDMVPLVFSLNQDLAKGGAFIAVGTVVVIPTPAAMADLDTQGDEIVRLWE